MLSPEPRETPSAPAHRRSPAPELPDPVFCWRGARAPARLSLGPRDRARVCRAPLLPVFRSRFPERQEGRGRARGGERAGTRGPVGGRVRGAGAVSPRGAEPGRSEALSPAKGPLCRPRDPRVLHISRPRGIRTVSGARRPPRLSSPPPAFSGRTRLPGSSGGQGPGAPAGTGPQIPPGPGPPCASPAPRALLPGAAGRAAVPAREMQPLEAPSDADTGPPRLPAPPAAPAAAPGPVDTKRGGFAVCPPSAGAAPKLRLGVNCTRAASLIHVSGVKEPRVPTLGGRKVLYKGFVEGVLSPAKIRRKADVKAERSSKLPDDVKGGVDCGADAGESADVEIRHDLPGVFTGNGAAHGQNFPASIRQVRATD
ncbi:hypothetical protein R6Z07F_000007 [Ovis aries]